MKEHVPHSPPPLISIRLQPGVTVRCGLASRFNGFGGTSGKPLKRLSTFAALNTWLKPGANGRTNCCTRRLRACLPVLLLAGFIFSASARTITLKPEAIDAFATLSESHPRSGWAAQQIDPSLYVSNPPIGAPNTSCLIRYSFDQIPKGNRITHAEWVIPAGPAAASTVSVWRVIAEWGIGVCHQFRMVHPKRLEWSVPGARGRSVDRATRPTGSGKFGPGALQITVNVTQDVELWHSGAAPNRGWLLTFDSPSIIISPTHAGRQQWQLRITYEPE